MVVQTKLWGTLHETLEVPLTGSGSGARVHFSDSLLFPGLRRGERLHRVISLPARGTLLASDGTPLAQGPDRTSPIPDVASQIVGTLGAIPADLKATYAAPRLSRPTPSVGLDGLEHIFQDRLAGTAGGRLLAGRRVLATSAPVPAQPVRTTIIARDGARRRGRAGRPVRRDRGDEPAHRRAAGAGRDRRSRRCSRPARR